MKINSIGGEIDTDKLPDLKALLSEKIVEISEICQINNIAYSIMIDGCLSSFSAAIKKEDINEEGLVLTNAPSYAKYLNLLSQGINLATRGVYGVFRNPEFNQTGEEWKQK